MQRQIYSKMCKGKRADEQRCRRFEQLRYLEDLAKSWALGLVNFVLAIAYHFCLALPAAFTPPGDHLLAKPCTYWTLVVTSYGGLHCCGGC